MRETWVLEWLCVFAPSSSLRANVFPELQSSGKITMVEEAYKFTNFIHPQSPAGFITSLRANEEISDDYIK